MTVAAPALAAPYAARRAFSAMNEEGNFGYLAALALILQVLTLPLLWIGQKALGRDFMLRRTTT